MKLRTNEKIYKPCLAAFETKERGKTFQLNSSREIRPPLHQHMASAPFFFAVGLTPDSNNVPRLLAVFDAKAMICLEEPISTEESTWFSH